MLWARVLSLRHRNGQSRTLLRNEYLGAENRILRGQIKGRRLDDSARFSLILWSRFCDWKEALVIVIHIGIGFHPRCETFPHWTSLLHGGA